MNESMDRVLADWLREGPESGPREGLERALAATRRVGQKPGWAFLERWLPMQLTMARTPSLRPILAVVMLALLIVALVATALFIGSHRRPLPRAVRSGAQRRGRLLGGRRPVHRRRPVRRSARARRRSRRRLLPECSRTRATGSPSSAKRTASFQVMIGHARRIGPQALGRAPGRVSTGCSWSPDGNALLVELHGNRPHRASSSPSSMPDGSGSHELDRRHAADYAVVAAGRPSRSCSAARPRRRHCRRVHRRCRRHERPSSCRSNHVEIVDFEGLSWSPDGKHLSFMSAGSLGGVTRLADQHRRHRRRTAR